MILKKFKFLNLTLFTIILLSFLPGAEIDICISAFPIIKKFFNLSTFQVEFLLTFNLIFHLISAFIVGFFADKYGKKNMIIVGLIVFLIGSFVSCIENFYFILFGRVLQGIGSAAPMILSSLLILDLYQDKNKQSQMISFLNGIAIVGISSAPVIGSKMTLLFNWRGSFIFLIFFTIITLILTIFFIKDKAKNQEKIEETIANKTEKLLKSFTFVKDKQIIFYLIYVATAVSAYYTYLSMSSILYIEVFKASIAEFGYFQGTTALVFGTLSCLNGSIVKKIGQKNAFVGSICFILMFLILEIFAMIFNLKNPYLFCIMMLFSSVGAVFPVNLMYVGAINYADKNKGKMSSVLTLVRWSLTIFLVHIASFFYNQTIISTIIINFAMTATSVFFIFVLIARDKKIEEDLQIENQIVGFKKLLNLLKLKFFLK